MPSIINILIFILWLMSASIDYADFTYLWQLKEYRIDKIKDFFSTREGKTYWIRYQLFWRSLIVIAIFLLLIHNVFDIKIALIFIFTIDALYNLDQWRKHKLHRPNLTKKAQIILLTSIIIEGGLFVLLKNWNVLLLLLIIRFVIAGLSVYLVSFPSDWTKHWIIHRATIKMSDLQNQLTVIGITGSYAKTSTKEFLAHILEKKYVVVRTPEHVNTQIGVSQFILKTDFSKAKFFVVEMGAYSKGEIKAICDIVHPKIGILTAINEQHLSLFGTIKNIQEAKYELLRSLTKDGLAITNVDDPYCREYLNELHCKVFTFGTDTEYHPTCVIEDIKTTRTGFCCTITAFDEKEKITLDVPMIGTHNAFNLAPVILVTHFVGMNKKEIFEAIQSMPPQIGSIHLYQYGQAIIIDDTYNSNPTGFKAALDILSSFPSNLRRIVITRGMEELGKKSKVLHEEIGGEITYISDELIVTKKNAYKTMHYGVGNKYRTQVVLKDNPIELLTYIRKLKNTQCVILFENRQFINIAEELKIERQPYVPK